ncbi:MAG TPA: polyhydroxyalkanoate synthesis regulator DNA-binding domain-containing protein [Terriglobales bacterium]|nr:polyhydroxyalkanoate synthesis regulator DNA-binding domain-containing protein [Terriglobales bacterium]
MKPAPVIIKKYANRRLYDTTNSRYVNLDEIAALVQQGKDVQVVDAVSGQDLTRVTLTQIITENTKERPGGLPIELLRQIIMASDQVGQEFLTWYLKSAFDTYQKVQDAVQNRFTQVESAILSPVEAMKRFLGSAAPAAASPNNSESEVAALQQRLAELESVINARSQAPRRGKRKPTKRSISRRGVTRAADADRRK